MQKIIPLLLCLVTATSSFSQNDTNNQLEKSVDNLIATQFKKNEPGISVLIASKNGIIYKKAFGSANVELNVLMQPDMIFRIGSITKQFTAIGILQLVEQGKISLQDSVQKYIPEFPFKGYTITIENLLTHTSAIPDYSNGDTTNNPYIERHDFTPQQIIKYFDYMPLEFKPGTKYSYSNSGYVLLAYIIEKVSGESYHAYMKENVIKRAGLTNTLFAKENVIVPNRVQGYTRDRGFYENCEYQTASLAFGCGDLMSTTEDLYKWNQALLTYKLVRKETLDKAFTPFILSSGNETEYGYGWFINNVNEHKCIHHEGQVSGFIGVEQYFPNENIYVVILTNLKSGEDTTDFSSKRFELFNNISKLALGEKIAEEVTLNDAVLNSYTGTYDAGKQLIDITKKNDQLIFNGALDGHYELVQISVSKFIIRNVSPQCTIEFIKDSLGNIKEFISQQKGRFNWVRVNENKSSTQNDISRFIDFVGKYQLLTMRGAFTSVMLENNKLMTESTTGLPKAELIPVTENTFRYSGENYGLLYEFVKNKNGKVNKLIITQQGGVHCKKIK
jgi:CubicO group peptidase (beta-lactamase class C family)